MSAHRSELRILDRRARNAHRRKMKPARMESRATMKQVANVLCEFRDLLDDYAPAWYSAEQHSRLESAIQMLSQR